MKLCYKLKMHRGIDGMFVFSSGLCSWINKDSRICSRRQLLSLPIANCYVDFNVFALYNWRCSFERINIPLLISCGLIFPGCSCEPYCTFKSFCWQKNCFDSTRYNWRTLHSIRVISEHFLLHFKTQVLRFFVVFTFGILNNNHSVNVLVLCLVN